MRTLYIRHVPDAVAERLEKLAQKAGLPLSSFALQELTETARRADGSSSSGGGASALVDALLINGAARAWLSEASLHAPELIDAEPLSVLTRLVLRGQLMEQQALPALDTAQLLGLRRYTTRQLWPRAWQLRTNLSAYDALYVALAEQLNLPLLSADGRLARAPGLHCQVRVP